MCRITTPPLLPSPDGTAYLVLASSKADHVAIDRVLAEFGRDAFVETWLADRGLLWAADLIPNLTNVEVTS